MSGLEGLCKFKEELKEWASARLQKRFIHNFLSIQQIYFQKMYTTSTDPENVHNIYWSTEKHENISRCWKYLLETVEK